MQPWQQDIAKEVITLVIGAVVAVLRSKVKSVIKDVNCYFARVRAMEARIAVLESCGKAESRPHQDPSHDQAVPKDPCMGCRNDG